jgi:hypothetical protein
MAPHYLPRHLWSVIFFWKSMYLDLNLQKLYEGCRIHDPIYRADIIRSLTEKGTGENLSRAAIPSYFIESLQRQKK